MVPTARRSDERGGLMRRAVQAGLALAACLVFAPSAAALTQVPGSPFSTGQGSDPSSVAFSPSGNLLAVGSDPNDGSGPGTISVFSVDQTTGALTQVPGSPFSPNATGSLFGSGVGPVAFSPNGDLLVAANDGLDYGSLSMFSVNPTTGALTEVSGSPFDAGEMPYPSIAFSPGGGLLAATTNGDDGGAVAVFSVDQSTGALSEVSGSPFDVAGDAGALAFNPSGGLIATVAGSALTVFSVDQSTGALSEVSGSPFASGEAYGGLAFSSDGGLLAATAGGDDQTGTVLVFSVDQSTGALTQVSGSAPLTYPFSVAFSPVGGLLAAVGVIATTCDCLSVWTVTPSGALTPVSGSPASTAEDGAQGVTFSPNGELLATANPIGSVSVFSTNSSTTPPPPGGSPPPAGTSPPAGTGPPSNTARPRLTGVTKPGKALACSRGSWSNNPTMYAYRWYRNGTLLAGFTAPTYTLGTLDEGTALKCVVKASNAAGQASATSNAVTIPIPKVALCPGATGSMTGTTIGQITLGMTRSRARYLYRQHSNRGKQYQDFFCLTPIGVRVGYASPILLDSLAKHERATYQGRVVWASTSNPYYSLDGIRAGESIATASRVLDIEPPFHIGLNYWYLARKASYTAVLKVRGNVVQELGIADNALTTTRPAQNVLMHSFY